MKYAYSETQKGPWLGSFENPTLALGAARARLGNVVVYVASVRPIRPSDGMMNIRAWVGDIRESLVDTYGSGADDFFDDPEVQAHIESIGSRVDALMDKLISDRAEISFMVPQVVRSYPPDRHVKTGDFPG